MRATSLGLVVLVALLLGAAPGPLHPGSSAATPAAALVFGDLDCGGTVGIGDAQKLARSLIGLAVTQGEGCPAISEPVSIDGVELLWGDVDCGGSLSIGDAQKLARNLIGLAVSQGARCPDIGEALNVGGPPGNAELAARLAEEITTGTVVDAVEGVQWAFARSGVATGDLTETFVAAEEPAPGTVSLPLESLMLGLEARHRETAYRMTAAELGQMLADFGWPFLTDSTPGEQIVALLSAWVRGAQQLPDDPVSFGPLFLQQMAARQDPPVDLAAGAVAAEDVHFSLLEFDVFAALLDRLTIRPEAGPEARAAAAVDPCSDAKNAMSGVFGPFGGQVYGLITSQAGPFYVQEGLQVAGVSAETAGDLGTALGALSIATKIWKLIAFYANEDVEVTSSNDTVHKPLVDGSKYVLFTARAGVSEEDWQEYQDKLGGELGSDIARAMKHCLNEYGLSTFADLGEIADDAENWSVSWRLLPHSPQAGDIRLAGTTPKDNENVFDFPGMLQNKLERTSPYSAETDLRVTILTEDEQDHPAGADVQDCSSAAPCRTTDATVCAYVEAAQPPSLGTFFNATQGLLGLFDAIAELAAGWLQAIATPQSCYALHVQYHHSPCPGAPAGGGGSQAPGVSSAAGGAASGATTDFQFPCAYEGTFNSTSEGQANHVTFNQTASGTNLRFELLNSSPWAAHYLLVAGSLEATLSGTRREPGDDCTVSGHATFDFPQDSGEFLGINLALDLVAGTYFLALQAIREGVGQEVCYFGGEPEISTTQTTYVAVLTGFQPLGDVQSLKGSLTDGTSHYEWDLHAAECRPSPEPVCQ